MRWGVDRGNVGEKVRDGRGVGWGMGREGSQR